MLYCKAKPFTNLGGSTVKSIESFLIEVFGQKSPRKKLSVGFKGKSQKIPFRHFMSHRPPSLQNYIHVHYNALHNCFPDWK